MKNFILLFSTLLFLHSLSVIPGKDISSKKIKFVTASSRNNFDFSTNDPLCSSDDQCGQKGYCCRYTSGCYCSFYKCNSLCGGGGGNKEPAAPAADAGGDKKEGGDAGGEAGGKLMNVLESQKSKPKKIDTSGSITEDTGKKLVKLLSDIKHKLASKDEDSSDSEPHKPHKHKKKKKKKKTKTANAMNEDSEESKVQNIEVDNSDSEKENNKEEKEEQKQNFHSDALENGIEQGNKEGSSIFDADDEREESLTHPFKRVKTEMKKHKRHKLAHVHATEEDYKNNDEEKKATKQKVSSFIDKKENKHIYTKEELFPDPDDKKKNMKINLADKSKSKIAKSK